MKQAPITASMAFLAAMAGADMTLANELEADAPSGTLDYFENLENIPGVFNGAGQCVRSAEFSPYSAGTSFGKTRVSIMTEILARDEIGATLVSNLQDQDYAICFAETNYGVGAAHYPDYNAIVLNQNASEGCLISGLSHEAQHALQKTNGITAPVRDLEPWDNQERLILATEHDASVIQSLVSWRLAQPSYTEEPYIGALECIYTDYAESTPYFAEAADALNDISAAKPEWIENGQAARQLHEIFATNRKFWLNYSTPFRSMYQSPFGNNAECEELSGGGCFEALYTLNDLGIDPDIIGGIHYDQNYRERAYDEALGTRPAPQDRVYRFIPLP